MSNKRAKVSSSLITHHSLLSKIESKGIEMAVATEFIVDYSKLATLFEAGLHRAQNLGRAVLVSYSQAVPDADPLYFFAECQQAGQRASYWERPSDKFAMAGAGTAYLVRGEGKSRFGQVDTAWSKLVAEALIEGELAEESGVGPVLLGGFAFDPSRPSSDLWNDYGDALMVLPQVQLTRRENRTFLTINTLVDTESDPAYLAQQAANLYRQPAPTIPSIEPNSLSLEDVRPTDWKTLIAEAVERIRAGAFRKVVLAREVRAVAKHAFEAGTVLERLRKNFLDATVFAFAQEGRAFLGATPERLVQLSEGEVRTAALAGTIGRGATPEEDVRLSQELLNSSKNQGEHAVVIDLIHSALKKVCVSLYTGEPPRLLKLQNVQHLYTPIIGRLRERGSILKLVEVLHPTPALGGFPREEALDFIRRREGFDRGWYGAPVGWLDQRGEGEFVVAIRSALLDGQTATLFAGCGIVADSEPESEYTESCAKLRAMLSALEG